MNNKQKYYVVCDSDFNTIDGCKKSDITAKELKEGMKYKYGFHNKNTRVLIEYLDGYYVLTNSNAYNHFTDNNKYSTIKELYAALTNFYPMQ